MSLLKGKVSRFDDLVYSIVMILIRLLYGFVMILMIVGRISMVVCRLLLGIECSMDEYCKYRLYWYVDLLKGIMVEMMIGIGKVWLIM